MGRGTTPVSETSLELSNRPKRIRNKRKRGKLRWKGGKSCGGHPNIWRLGRISRGMDLRMPVPLTLPWKGRAKEGV